METESTIKRNLEAPSESQTRRDVELEVPVSNKKSEQVEQGQSLQRSIYNLAITNYQKVADLRIDWRRIPTIDT